MFPDKIDKAFLDSVVNVHEYSKVYASHISVSARL